MNGFNFRNAGFFLVIFLSTAAIFSTAAANGIEALRVTLPVLTGKYTAAVVSLGSFGLRGEATALMKIPENAEIIAGYLYLSGYSSVPLDSMESIPAVMSNADSLKINVTAEIIGYSTESTNWRFTCRAEVTDAVGTGETQYKVEDVTLPVIHPAQGQIYGGGLVVIYSLPGLPEANIWIADGLDYFSAEAGFPYSDTVVLPFSGIHFERYGWVKIFAGVDERNSAGAIWYQSGSGTAPEASIADAPNALDFQNSSAGDLAENTEPLSTGLGVRQRWSMVEFMMNVQPEQEWVAFEMESETDQMPKPSFSGVWNMIAFKLPLEETGCGTLGDRIFYDKNENGVRDQMEPGVPGIKVSLFRDNDDGLFDPATDSRLDSALTNRLGFYLFQNLDFGTYFVDLDHPRLADTSLILTAQSDPSAPIPVENGTPVLNIDFGLAQKIRQPYNPVRLKILEAYNSTGGISLRWSAESKSENFGFDIYRSNNREGNYQLVNPELIQTTTEESALHEYSFEDTQVEANQTYFYKLADVDIAGNTTIYGPVSATTASTVAEYMKNNDPAKNYELFAAYPNPFNSRTMLQYQLPDAGFVQIEVFNVLGQKVRTLQAEDLPGGTYRIHWDAINDFGQPLSSGVYFIKMAVNGFHALQRILYLK